MRALICAGLASVALAVASPAAYANGLGGALSGGLTQDNPPTSYDVDIELYGASGSITYPTLSCGGILSFIQEAGGAYVYREHITSGVGRCIDGGTIELSPTPFHDPNNRAWNFRWTGDGVLVRGVLSGSVTAVP